MSSILQGTTPSLEITISTEDFAGTDIVKLELVMKNGSTVITNGLEDVTVNAKANSITKTFTEAETLALNPQSSLVYQLRFVFADGSIVGTQKASIRVEDLISEEMMSE